MRHPSRCRGMQDDAVDHDIARRARVSYVRDTLQHTAGARYVGSLSPAAMIASQYRDKHSTNTSHGIAVSLPTWKLFGAGRAEQLPHREGGALQSLTRPECKCFRHCSRAVFPNLSSTCHSHIHGKQTPPALAALCAIQWNLTLATSARLRTGKGQTTVIV